MTLVNVGAVSTSLGVDHYANQRESGRWFTRSLYKDSRHFLSHAGTNMAVLALAACDQLK